MLEISSFIAGLPKRYPLVDVSRRFGNCEYRLTCVRDQDALLSGITDEAEIDNFPFGLLLWASAIALSERIIEEPSLVARKSVLEIGAGGVGLPGLVAKQMGAERVLQTDYHTESLTLLAQNAAQNGYAGRVEQLRADWRSFPELGQPFDVVIGSDVLYERTLHDPLLTLLPRLVVPGGLLLLSDPMRPQALSFMARLEAETGEEWLPAVMTGQRTTEPDGGVREIAIFCVRRKKF
ncbi:MAG: methyltransferase domain-containing protein [Akkermansiaceae bacterium]|nr:methyltransferase domain-containing protein [Armatimonadota bacterium]